MKLKAIFMAVTFILAANAKSNQEYVSGETLNKVRSMYFDAMSKPATVEDIKSLSQKCVHILTAGYSVEFPVNTSLDFKIVEQDLGPVTSNYYLRAIYQNFSVSSDFNEFSENYRHETNIYDEGANFALRFDHGANYPGRQRGYNFRVSQDNDYLLFATTKGFGGLTDNLSFGYCYKK